MALRVALIIDGDASGAKAAATEAKAAVASVETAAHSSDRAIGEAFGRQLLSAQGAAGAVERQANAAAGAVNRTAGAAAGAVRLNTFQMQNMAFQMNDMAVMLASGQSPFVMLMQQGMQVSQLFAPGTGVGAALKATGAAIVSFITNPLNLAVLGFAAGAAVVPMFFNAILGGGESSEDVLERHETLIGRIKRAWPEATEGVREYGRESIAVLRYQLERQAEETRAAIRAAAEDIVAGTKDVQNRVIEGYGDVPELRTAEVFAPFAAAIERLRATAAAGRPDIQGFRQDIAAIAATDPANAQLQRLAEDLLATSEEGLELDRALTAAEDAIRRTGAAAGAETAAVASFGDALRALSGIALPDLDDRARAAQEFDKALRNASGTEERQLVFRFYEETLGRITGREQEAAAAAAARGTASVGASRTATEGFRNELDAMQPLIDAQKRAIAGWDEMRGVAAGAFSDIASGLRNGATAGEILLGIANRIADAFLRAGAVGFETLLLGARGSAPGGLLGGLAGAATKALFTPAPIYHTGGVVGSSVVPTRMVPLAAVASAPRFHDGLRPGERFGIFEDGETIIPKGGRAGATVVNHWHVSTPSPRAFAESRSTVARAAGRMLSRVGRFT